MKEKSKKAVYELYSSAWSAISDEERLRRLEGSVTSDFTYLDSQAKTKGPVELAAFLADVQRKDPGCRFALSEFRQHHEVLLANWVMTDKEGNIIATGYDSNRFNEAGLMVDTIGYANLPEQRVE